jgi:hypothetical protein
MHSIITVVDVKILLYKSLKDTHFGGICCQTPTTHIISTFEPLYVISVKYRLSLPDDGSYVIRNMLE